MLITSYIEFHIYFHIQGVGKLKIDSILVQSFNKELLSIYLSDTGLGIVREREMSKARALTVRTVFTAMVF